MSPEPVEIKDANTLSPPEMSITSSSVVIIFLRVEEGYLNLCTLSCYLKNKFNGRSLSKGKRRSGT